jgi:hypothetical protein
MEDRIPLSPEEEAEMLSPPERRAASLKKMMEMIEADEAAHAEQKLALSRQARDAFKRKLDEALQHRPRVENLAIVAKLEARPDFASVTAYHRNFQSLSDTDLDVLVADLQALLEMK